MDNDIYLIGCCDDQQHAKHLEQSLACGMCRIYAGQYMIIEMSSNVLHLNGC